MTQQATERFIAFLLRRQRLLLPLQQALPGETRQRREPDKGKRGRSGEPQEKGPRVVAALVEGDPRHHRLLHRRHHLHRPQILPPSRPGGLCEGKTKNAMLPVTAGGYSCHIMLMLRHYTQLPKPVTI